MVNKRGWLRIVEAFIAVLLILGAIAIFINERKKENDNSESFYVNSLLEEVLEEIANNKELRNIALEKNESSLKEKVKQLFKDDYDFDIRLCNLTEKYCMMNKEYPKKEVFVQDRIVSANLSYYDPVKVRVFVWRKD